MRHIGQQGWCARRSCKSPPPGSRFRPRIWSLKTAGRGSRASRKWAAASAKSRRRWPALRGSRCPALPAGTSPGLAAADDYQPSAMTYCNGTHVAEAEVDPATGVIRLTRYVVVHDCGRLINPMMVEGQVIGGVVHGIGSTLFEMTIYGEDGQPQTGTYADYLLPTADVVPRIEVHHMESPTPLNPLGIKGAGESGTIAASAAVTSAVEDALRDFGVTITELPMTPARIFAALKAAG